MTIADDTTISSSSLSSTASLSPLAIAAFDSALRASIIKSTRSFLLFPPAVLFFRSAIVLRINLMKNQVAWGFITGIRLRSISCLTPGTMYTMPISFSLSGNEMASYELTTNSEGLSRSRKEPARTPKTQVAVPSMLNWLPNKI